MYGLDAGDQGAPRRDPPRRQHVQRRIGPDKPLAPLQPA